MVFSSIVFLFCFLPAVLILYYPISNAQWRNILLVIVSLLFYAYGEPVYVLLMLLSIAANYAFGLWIGKAQKKDPDQKKAGQMILTAAVIFNIGMLVIFKYTGMLTELLNAIARTSIPIPNIALPVGISFFTFQALSYVIDVYRKDVPAQSSLLHIMLYISFFPQLIAGPIVKYHDIEQEIASRTISWQQTAQGMQRFSIGLAKKILIANTIAYAVDQLYAAGPMEMNAPAAWMFAIGYVFQIYFDFSGYSDMAIGMGLMFGFHFKENFNYPYISTSIQEFWRRWHISLSTWFKEYLYIPLGGNRKGKVRTSVNKLIVFTATGLWHGANLTFLVWGLWHGFFILLEQWVDLKKIPAFLRWIGTMLVVILGFVVFRADTLGAGFQIIGRMFAGGWQNSGLLGPLMTPVCICAFVSAAIFSLPWSKWMQAWLPNHGQAESGSLLQSVMQSGQYAISLLLLCASILMLSAGGYNPFIYFRF